jgi:hypothetical protein
MSVDANLKPTVMNPAAAAAAASCHQMTSFAGSFKMTSFDSH